VEREALQRNRPPSLLHTKGKVELAFGVTMSEEFRDRTVYIVK